MKLYCVWMGGSVHRGPSPCIDFSMSFSYKKIHKVCAMPNLILMSVGFWVIVKNALLRWTLRELQKSFCPSLSPFLLEGNCPSRLFKCKRGCLCESNMNEVGHSLALWLMLAVIGSRFLIGMKLCESELRIRVGFKGDQWSPVPFETWPKNSQLLSYSHTHFITNSTQNK